MYSNNSQNHKNHTVQIHCNSSSACGSGCLACHENATSVICDECSSVGYTMDTSQYTQPCQGNT